MTSAAPEWVGWSFRAMNTTVEVQVYPSADTTDPTDGLFSVQRMFAKAERHMSRFDPKSELSRLNASAGRQVEVSSLLFDVVEAAIWAAHATGGMFDPTILPALRASGYDRSFDQMTAGQEQSHSAPASRRGTYTGISLNRRQRQITLPEHTELDLGGIGKGWTVDRAADWLSGSAPFLVNAGGDLYAYGTPPGRQGWSIDITDPFEDDRDIDRVTIRQQALVTSTVGRRRWQQNNRWQHHLIDPRRGEPANSDAYSVTVIGQRAVTAEVYAKVALLLGIQAGAGWLERIPDVEALLVSDRGQVTTTSGWTEYQTQEVRQ